MDTAVMTDWSLESREQHFHQVVRGGWSRIKPPLVSLMLIALVGGEEPLTLEQWRAYVRSPGNPGGEWDGSCWDEPAQEGDEGAAEEASFRAEASGYAAHFGLPGLETVADVVRLLEAAGVVKEIADADGVPRLHPVTPFPYPEDVLPLGSEEREIQRRLRIQRAYEGDSYKIISLLEPDGKRLPSIKTSLQRLARIIDGVPFDARQAVLLLLDAGAFTASVDVAEAEDHKVFELRCDWGKFDESRIAIHGFDEDRALEVAVPHEE